MWGHQHEMTTTNMLAANLSCSSRINSECEFSKKEHLRLDRASAGQEKLQTNGGLLQPHQTERPKLSWRESDSSGWAVMTKTGIRFPFANSQIMQPPGSVQMIGELDRGSLGLDFQPWSILAASNQLIRLAQQSQDRKTWTSPPSTSINLRMLPPSSVIDLCFSQQTRLF